MAGKGAWMWLLFPLLLLQTALETSSTFTSPISCTYANSTCSECSRACLQRTLFPLFPSQCNPDSESLEYIEGNFYPGRSSVAVQIPSGSDGVGYTVPSYLIPPVDSLSNGYTITTYFKDSNRSASGTLLQLDDFLTLMYVNEEVALQVENASLSLILNGGNQWKDVSVTVAPDYISLYSAVDGYIAAQVSITIDAIDDIIIGMMYSEQLQDFIIYDMPLNDSSPHPLATFVSQCYCSENFDNTSDECVGNDGVTRSPRFNSSSNLPTDFAADGSLATAWTSEAEVSPVTFYLGFSSKTPLYKIFITFSTSSYESAVLEFMNDSSSTWKTLQQYAIDCLESFGVLPEGELNSTGFNCLPVTNSSVLRFYLQGSTNSMRTVDSSTVAFFTATQVRITLSGFENGSSSYSIQRFEICSDPCLDLDPSCNCSQSDVTPTMTEMIATSTISEEDAIFSTQADSDQSFSSSAPSNELESSFSTDIVASTALASTDSSVLTTAVQNMGPISTTLEISPSSVQGDVEPSASMEMEDEILSSQTESELPEEEGSTSMATRSSAVTSAPSFESSTSVEDFVLTSVTTAIVSEGAAMSSSISFQPSPEESDSVPELFSTPAFDDGNDDEETDSSDLPQIPMTQAPSSSPAADATSILPTFESTSELIDVVSMTMTSLLPNAISTTTLLSSAMEDELIQPSSVIDSAEELASSDDLDSVMELMETETSQVIEVTTTESSLPTSFFSEAEETSVVAVSDFSSVPDLPSSPDNILLPTPSSFIEPTVATPTLSEEIDDVPETLSSFPPEASDNLIDLETSETLEIEPTQDSETVQTSNIDDVFSSEVEASSATDEAVELTMTPIGSVVASTVDIVLSSAIGESSSRLDDEFQPSTIFVPEASTEILDLLSETEEFQPTSNLEDVIQTSLTDFSEELIPSSEFEEGVEETSAFIITPSVAITDELDSTPPAPLLTPSPSLASSEVDEESLGFTIQPSVVVEETELVETTIEVTEASSEVVEFTEDASDLADSIELTPTFILEEESSTESEILIEPTITLVASPSESLLASSEDLVESTEDLISSEIVIASSEEFVEPSDGLLESTLDFGSGDFTENNVFPTPSPVAVISSSIFTDTIEESLETEEAPSLETTINIEISTEFPSISDIGSGDFTDLLSEFISTPTLAIPIPSSAIEEGSGEDFSDFSSEIFPTLTISSVAASDEFDELVTSSSLEEFEEFTTDIPEIEPTPSAVEEFSSEIAESTFFEESVEFTIEPSPELSSFFSSDDFFSGISSTAGEGSGDVSDIDFSFGSIDLTDEIFVTVTPSEPFSSFVEASEDLTDFIEFSETPTETIEISSEELEASSVFDIVFSTPAEGSGDFTDLFDLTPSLTIEMSVEESVSTLFESFEESVEFTDFSIEPTPFSVAASDDFDDLFTSFSFEDTIEMSDILSDSEVPFATTEIELFESATIEVTDEFILPSSVVESSVFESEELLLSETFSSEIEVSTELFLSSSDIFFGSGSGDFSAVESIPSVEETPFPSPSSSEDDFGFLESSSLEELEQTSIVFTSEIEVESIEESPFLPSTEFIDFEESSLISFEPSISDIESSQIEVSFTSEVVLTEGIEITEVVSPTEELLPSDFELSTSFEFFEALPSSEIELFTTEVEPIAIEPTISLVIEEPTPTSSIPFISSSSSSSLITAASSEVIFPSPTPMSAVCNISNLQQPFIPFDVTVSGYGFERTTEPASSAIDETLYMTNISAIPSPGFLSSMQSSEIKVTLEDTLLGSFTLAHTPDSFSVKITGSLSGTNVYEDKPTVYAVVLATNVNLDSTVTEVEVTIMIMDEEFNCTINSSQHNFCITPLTVPTQWFYSENNVPVPVTATANGQQENITLGFLTLSASLTPNKSDGIYIVGPNFPVRPGEEVVLQVYAAFDTLLFVYSLDCNATGAELDANASFEWSLLTDHRLNNSRLAATGFRVYNQYNTSSTGQIPDSLFNLTLNIFGAVSESDDIKIMCGHSRLAFTNGTETSGSTSMFLINLEAEQIVNIFAYAPQLELLNIPSLTDSINTSVPLTVSGFSSTGILSEVKAFCQSSNENVLQVARDCSAVYFRGDETSGADRVEIMVMFDNRLNTSIYFRVLYVYNVTLEIEDNELNLIESECSGLVYQRSPVSISGIAFTESSSTHHYISLTDYLAEFLESSNSTVANITNGEVVGVGEGVADIFLSNIEGVVDRVNVTSDPVCIYNFEVLHFSDVFIESVSHQQPVQVSIALQQQYQYILSNLTLFAVATFSDGYRTRIDQEDGIRFEVDHEDLDMIGYNQFIIKNPRTNFNITASWMSSSCEISGREITVNVPLLMTPTLNVTVSSPVLAHRDDPSADFDVPTRLDLFVDLHYSDRVIKVMENDAALRIECPPSLNCSGLSITAGSTFKDQSIINIFYSTSTLLLRDSIEVEPVNITLELEARLSETSNPTDMLQRVGSSGQHLMATVIATLHFSTNRTEDVTSKTALNYATFPDGVNLSSEQLTMQRIINASSDTNSSNSITVNGTLQLNSGSLSGQLTILLTNESLQVMSIDNIVLTESDIINELYIDCEVTLQGGIKLTQTFINATSLYPNLITFNISGDNNDIAEVRQEGLLILLKNSPNPIELIVASDGNQSRMMFYSNLKPRMGEADLGENVNLSKPLADVMQSDSFTVPVVLNSEGNSTGVYRINIQIDPKEALTVNQVVQAENWRNGSLVYFENPGLVTVGGVLNTGAKGSLVRLANITFTACPACTDRVTFTIEVEQLFEANRALDPLPTGDTTSVDLQIKPLGRRRRRSAGFSQHRVQRRQASTTTDSMVDGDFTGDGKVDLSDLYALQVRVSDAVFDSSILTVNLSDISVIEQTSLGLDFTLDIAHTVYLDDTDQCMLRIYGNVSNAGNSSFDINTNLVHLLLMFTSNDSSFLDEFQGFDSAVEPQMGVFEPILRENGSFEVFGNVSQDSVFNVTAHIVVTTGEAFSSVITLIDSPFSSEVRLFDIAVEGRCVMSTTSVPTTEAITETVSTPTVTTEIETTEATSELPTTIVEISTPATTSEPTVLPTTLEFTVPEVTSESTTPPATTELTTLATTELTTPPATTELTTPPATTESTTPATMESTTLLATTELTTPATMEPTTPLATMESTTPPATTESTTPATMESTAPPATMESTTTPATTELTTPTTMESTTPPATMESTTPAATESTTSPATTESTTPLATTESTTPATTESTTPETADEKTTKSTDGTTDKTEVTLGMGNGGSSPNLSTIFGPMAVVVIILVVLIAISACVIWRQKRHSKDRYSPGSAIENHQRSNRLSGNFFFSAEEGIEMSPIDIVPIQENTYLTELEASMDLVPKHNVYPSEKTGPTVFDSFERPAPKQATITTSKTALMPKFDERPVLDPPPAYTGTSATAKSQITNSSYEIEEEDDMLDFRFEDGGHTQNYLSLGLTPLSQLSPPDHGSSPTGGENGNCFFPSMPPPVTPISSVFSIAPPSSNQGIPLDSPFNISGGDGIMMPEANPVSERAMARKTRKGKHDIPVHHGMTLEPVPEQSCSLDENYPHNIANGIIGSSTSSDSTDDPSTGLLFPSADLNHDIPSHLQRKTGKRLKSGTRRKQEDSHHLSVDQDPIVVKNHAFMDSPPVRLTPSYSPRQQGKNIRQEMREKELARQKELLRRQKLEEEQARLLSREMSMQKIARDYGATRLQASNHEPQHIPLNLVQQEALRIEAQMELMKEEKSDQKHPVSIL